MNVNDILQYALTGIVGILCWFLRELWDAVQKLKNDLSETREDMHIIFVTKDDYKSDIGRVHELLDKIYDKLENKADR